MTIDAQYRSYGTFHVHNIQSLFHALLIQGWTSICGNLQTILPHYADGKQNAPTATRTKKNIQHGTEHLYSRVVIMYDPPEDGQLHGRNTYQYITY